MEQKVWCKLGELHKHAIVRNPDTVYTQSMHEWWRFVVTLHPYQVYMPGTRFMIRSRRYTRYVNQYCFSMLRNILRPCFMLPLLFIQCCTVVSLSKAGHQAPGAFFADSHKAGAICCGCSWSHHLLLHDTPATTLMYREWQWYSVYRALPFRTNLYSFRTNSPKIKYNSSAIVKCIHSKVNIHT